MGKARFLGRIPVLRCMYVMVLSCMHISCNWHKQDCQLNSIALSHELTLHGPTHATINFFPLVQVPTYLAVPYTSQELHYIVQATTHCENALLADAMTVSTQCSCKFGTEALVHFLDSGLI